MQRGMAWKRAWSRMAVLSLACAGALAADTHYQIDLSEAASGWLNVSVEAPCGGEACEVQMPVWSATYQVRDFAQYIARMEARGPKGEEAAAHKIGPSRWRSRHGRCRRSRHPRGR